MPNRDRRAQRKRKKRAERIRQDKHVAKSSPASSGPDPMLPLQGMPIDVHHVPGGASIVAERARRTFDFFQRDLPAKNRQELKKLIGTHMIGDAWLEDHHRMLATSVLEQAQELAFTALQEEDPGAAVKWANQALTLDPLCCDAQVILATHGTIDHDTRIDIFTRIIDTEFERLGGETFLAENSDHFWGIPHTRPLMRAQFARALALKAGGEFGVAAEDFNELISLSPRDIQGARFHYLACVMAGELFDELKIDIIDFRDDHNAAWLWARVLERLLLNDFDGAHLALTNARRANSLVAAVLRRPKSKRPPCPPRYERGEATEAVYIVDVFACAWDSHPEASAWLREHA